jgi:hypothetical protein
MTLTNIRLRKFRTAPNFNRNSAAWFSNKCKMFTANGYVRACRHDGGVNGSRAYI